MAKDKKCKFCGAMFTPFNSMQRTCSPACAIEDGRDMQKKDFKRAIRAEKARLKPKSKWMKEAQAALPCRALQKCW